MSNPITDPHLHNAFREAEWIWAKWFRSKEHKKLRQYILLCSERRTYPDLTFFTGWSAPLLDSAFKGRRDPKWKQAIKACAFLLEQELQKAVDSGRHQLKRAIFPAGEESFDRHLLRVESGDYTRAHLPPEQRHHVPKPQGHRIAVAEKVQEFEAIIGKLPAFKEIPAPDLSRLRQILASPGDARPFAFYHWRQLHHGLHWIDFYFLNILKSFQKLGFEVRALFTWDRLPNNDLPSLIEEVVGCKPIEYRDARAHEASYRRFTAQQVPSPHAQSAIWDGTKHQPDTETWIQFCPWYVHEHQRPGYLQIIWDRHYTAFRLANEYDNVKVVQLLTGDIFLNNALAKRSGPPLCLEAAPFPSFLDWINSSPKEEDLKTLAAFFHALNPSAGASSEGAPPIRIWVTAIRKLPAPLREIAELLYRHLMHWHGLYSLNKKP